VTTKGDPSSGPCGIVLIDKPPGPTSHDIVAACRRHFGLRRVGHAGTLDPPASGLLVVGLGAATRLLGYLSGTDKSYSGTAIFGAETSTLDAAGQVVAEGSTEGLDDRKLREAAEAFLGDILQIPPMVSAIKMGGRRLHELARAGVEVERRPRPVSIARFALEPLVGTTAAFEVDCSAGTYIRSLISDLGRAVGCGAHLGSLRRMRSGSFSVGEATTLEELERASILSLAEAWRARPTVPLSFDQVADVVHGRPVEAPPSVGEGPVGLLDPAGTLVGIGSLRVGRLWPDAVFGGVGA
jgi:tRNA pseudouridine55 synthase